MTDRITAGLMRLYEDQGHRIIFWYDAARDLRAHRWSPRSVPRLGRLEGGHAGAIEPAMPREQNRDAPKSWRLAMDGRQFPDFQFRNKQSKGLPVLRSRRAECLVRITGR